MKSIMTFIVVTIILSAIASVFYAGYLAIVYIWHLFDGLDSILRLTLLSSFAVFFLGCLIIAAALKSAAQTQLKAELSEAKITLYKKMLEVYEMYFSQLQTGVQPMRQEIQLKLQAMTIEMNVVAGAAVIEGYRKLDQAMQGQQSEDKQTALYQQLIKKMRQDIGHASNLDETRLKFLIVNQQVAGSNNSQHEVRV